MTDSPQPALPYRIRTRASRMSNNSTASTAPASPAIETSGDAAPDPEPEMMETPIVASAFVRSPAPPATKPVGYKNPPVEHRFKPGQRANPNGRPKGSKSLSTMVKEKFYAKVSVREGGRAKKQSKVEIGVTNAINKFAASGDIKTVLPLLKLIDPALDPALAPGGAVQPPSPELLTETNRRILDWFLARNAASDPEEGQGPDAAPTDEDGAAP